MLLTLVGARHRKDRRVLLLRAFSKALAVGAATPYRAVAEHGQVTG